MGDHEGWAQPSGLLPNGLLPNDTFSAARVLDMERWSKAEQQTAKLIARIQPNQPSEEHRKAVANYVQALIMKCFSCQVFTFGSVPLKTYLPDGDIDLTAMSEIENLKDTWASKVRDVLENEERNENSEFHVKEVQYIQAEVKIVKCLVENIVVDISFNQVGGLCTLCFLEEIDNLINQNHLFKRSIILIKAWCYYESRILGAHHGLISTYALETLVLYIFHVFNNTFSGPLEVLYRFLEFFSNFDWDNFCVSLWGPVPIGSLPDMNAEPPRKDSGELLLSKLFLHACSTVYAVFQGGQESQGQPFVSKHFNVIDPLRTNNNLGRSVSKGNFFRIRSAFSFGAKRLAKLLECPKDCLVAEVNQFFKNTWERHGGGHRPDARSPNLSHNWPLKTVPAEESNKSRSPARIKKKSENSQDSSSHVPNTTSQHSQNQYRTSSSSTSHSQSHRSSSDQFGRNISSNGTFQADRSQKSLPSDYSVSDREGQGRFQFARTQSSPELTKTAAEVSSRARNQVVETGKKQIAPARSDYGNRRNNIGSDASDSHSVRSSSFDDPSSMRHSSSHHSLEVGADSNSVSNSYQEELASVSETSEMQDEMLQEEQNLVNMRGFSRVQNFNGLVQIPMHLPSPHQPLTLSPVLASMSYSQRNLARVPNNISMIEPTWGSGVQLIPQGFVSSPLTHYFPTAGLNPNPDDKGESGNGNSDTAEVNSEDSWHEHDAGSSRGFDPDNDGFNFIHSSRRSDFSATAIRNQHKYAKENRGPAKEEYTDIYSNDRNTSLRFLPVTQANSSRSKSSSGSSRDGSSSTKVSRSPRDKWGTKPASSAVTTSLYGKAKVGWQFEGSSDGVSAQEDDDSGDWVPLSTMSTNVAERTASLVNPHARSHQLSGYEPAQTSAADSMIPIAPLLVGSTRPRVADNSGVPQYAFYATGPPVPFLIPMCNFPSDRVNSDGLKNHLDRDERYHSRITSSEQSCGSTESLDQSEGQMTSVASLNATPEPSNEQKVDILNSDFASHWQNLQYGRLCQNTRNHGPLMYPSQVPPVYLPGHFPSDGPGRPLSSNLNFFTQMMGYGPRLVPVAPLQSGANRPSVVFQHYGDEAPRYHGGTGTYLPNPKVPFRDRQYSSPRNHRGNYNYDRNEHNDREGSWIPTKARGAGRNHGRGSSERPNSRADRSAAAENRTDKFWNNSYRREPVASHNEVQNNSFGPTSSPRSSANIAYSMYPLPAAVGSNGVNPTGHAVPSSVVMLYPYDKSVGYGSSTAEPLEFGSLGPVRLSGMNEAPLPLSNGGQARHGTYQGDSVQTSPEQPSSPRVQRSTIQRNYQLRDEDFPPLSFQNQESGGGGGGGGGGNNYNNRTPRYPTFFYNPHRS